MSKYAERMMALFGGFRSAHGTHGDMRRNVDKGGKLEIKHSARTIREPVTTELWDQHLSGDYFLGIIPITEEGTSYFGCIDVDQYDINLADVAKQIKKRDFPMVVCRSKSGGAHVYLFMSHPVPAADLRAKLRQIAASLGWGESEIFPKQNQILNERGDLGNWLNMPYQNMTKPDRHGVKETMAAMSIDEFLSTAEGLRVDSLDNIRVAADAEDDADDLADGPPCLQHLTSMGFPPGQRNNGFFALATFAKKKYGSKWTEKLEEFNRRFFSPPRPADEVSDVIKRIEDKDYNYRCKDQPIVSYCNSVLCRQRKFGVGGGGHYPVVSGLSKLDTEPVIWFLDIEDQRIELSTKQLANYREFQMVCMDQLTVMFMPMKQETWQEMIGNSMQDALIIEAPPEMSTMGHFMELLEDFCTNRHRGETVDDIRLGKPWYDEDTKRHYFRLKDLMAYLEREGFRQWGRNKVGQVVRDMGGKHFFNLSGDGFNTFWVPSNFKTLPKVKLPDIREDPV